MKQDVLKLNRGFHPIGTETWRDTMVNIFSGAVHPLDVWYDVDEAGNVDRKKIVSMEVVKDFDSWKHLPLRDYDEYVKTSKGSIRMPSIVVCSKFNKIVNKKAVFPTKSNIWDRDNWTCFIQGTQVLTDTGFRNIEDIQVGDKIVNEKGLDIVLATISKYVNGKTLKIKSVGNAAVQCTYEHKFLVVNNRHKKMSMSVLNEITDNDFIYKSACEIEEGDFLVSPVISSHKIFHTSTNSIFDMAESSPHRRIQISECSIKTYHNIEFDRYVKFDNELAFLIGLYAAEGSCEKDMIVFSLHKKEQELQDKIRNFFKPKNINTTVRDASDGGQGVQVQVFNSLWRDLFSYMVPGKVDSKHFNIFIKKLPKDMMMEVIRGYNSGDGSLLHRKNINRTTVASVSKRLLYDIKFLSELLDMNPDYFQANRENRRRVFGLNYTAMCNRKLWGENEVPFRPSNKKYEVLYNNKKYRLHRVDHIEEVLYDGYVYDLSIQNVPQFTVENVLVHNCMYTGEKLTRETVSVDHILPVSKGGQNTWENLATCQKALNIWKGDRTPKECGLKLLKKPEKPKNSYSMKFMREEWQQFVDGGKFE